MVNPIGGGRCSTSFMENIIICKAKFKNNDFSMGIQTDFISLGPKNVSLFKSCSFFTQED